MIVNYMTIGDVVKKLGEKRHAVLYAHRNGYVPEPGWKDGRRAYQAIDLERLNRYFDAKKAKSSLDVPGG